ncbi:HlyD family type I secretion periplasmic adaptor subunit [Sphingomonas ginkgonis]|uniref:Membrane fusion protein (MFP) family protein n=1 Tax=Sphingomonas ginkgonis TaxID=2315330 RepID=A0A429V619_9SPHN|nr:HlyD family type I secretion periplasmic adaptor subunit [Sphingomonas ginkgonis]RST29393.1 HlyD family type I secretion periplasmic adaptor subunit [Sphingomonas ginkgonis]
MTSISLRSPRLLAPSSVPFVPPSSADSSAEIRLGLIVAFLFFVLFLGWAAVAPLDAAAQAGGRLAVSGQRQTVQHETGGVVSQILVREGQHVAQGQVLIRLAGDEARAAERSLSLQAISLLAQRERLRAEQAGLTTIARPAEFASLPLEDQPAANEAMRIQSVQLASRRSVLQSQQGASRARVSEAGSQASGYRSQFAGIDEQIRLLNQELAGFYKLESSGFVSKNRIREMERTRAELIAQKGQLTASIEQSHGQASESRLQGLEAQSSFMEKTSADLRDVEASLSDVMPKLQAARQQLARVEIRAPASGAVVGLAVFTPGGVVSPGQKLLDVVPDRAPLIVETRIPVSDGDDVRNGQAAYLRFDTLHDRSIGTLAGYVSRVSADAFTDEKTGASFYTAEVVVPLAELQKIEQSPERHNLRAGIPVSVQLPMRKRTALQYLFEPITGALSGSMHEK